jgi:ubiquinone/menaquinone biosynthesis C-methylase UbiE
MSVYSDKNFLAGQYQDAEKLNARITLHKRFSENKWFTWVFDHLSLPEKSIILELGCGSGELWKSNQDRIPPGWKLTLSDYSAGMAAEAWDNLMQIAQVCCVIAIDAQAIPLIDRHFSAVIANHMLYHVADRSRMFDEIQRMLEPGGCFYATTIGERHLAEIPELARQFDPELARQYNWGSNSFTLENGAEQLAPWFSSIELFRYPDRLLVTEAEPLADYILSCTRYSADRQYKEELVRFIQSRLDRNGVIEISKDSGMFIANRS